MMTKADRRLMLGLQKMDDVDRMFDEGEMYAFGRVCNALFVCGV